MKFKPLSDRIVVEVTEYQHDVLAVVGVALNKGRVIAVGPGKRQRRKQRFSAGEGMMGKPLWFEDGDETGKVYPMHVKRGDYVEFSPRQSVKFDIAGKEYLMIRQGSVYGTTNASQSDALLFQQSAGYDREGNFMSGKETAF